MRRSIYITALLSLFIVTACEESVDFEAMRAEEERFFQLYMDANYPDLEPTENGLYYIEVKEGTGASPDTGDYVVVNYLAYTIPDEQVVDTYDEAWAQEYNLFTSGVLYGPYKYKHGTEMEGMKEGVSMMKEGGIARLIFQSNLGYGENGVGSIGDFESLMYDIELVEVIDDVFAEEQAKISEYLLENPNFETISDPETGVDIYYFEDEVGDSTLVEEKDDVEVFYTGQLLDGRVFDSNVGQSSGFDFEVGNEEVIRGWDIGITYFRYGGKGRLLIPHQLAYGEEGSLARGTSKTSIPPVEALLFEMEVVKTSD